MKIKKCIGIYKCTVSYKISENKYRNNRTSIVLADSVFDACNTIIGMCSDYLEVKVWSIQHIGTLNGIASGTMYDLMCEHTNNMRSRSIFETDEE